jgi:hypothetical protein
VKCRKDSNYDENVAYPFSVIVVSPASKDVGRVEWDLGVSVFTGSSADFGVS